MKRVILVGCLLALLGLTTIGAVEFQTPPAPPPDTMAISLVCLNRETGNVEAFKGYWDGTQVPWLYTFVVVYKRMEPDGRGWKPVIDRAELWVVDIQKHTIQSITVQ